MTKKSRLQQILDTGEFAVTAEVGPPKGADFTSIREKASVLREYVDAINITDNQKAVVHLSSQACCGELARMGIDPVFQITCRDRNRIALQSDILGAVAQGVRNILCLTGDHQCFGNEKNSKGVFDLDSIQLVQALHTMARDGRFIGGDKLEAPVDVFIGAVANPFADPQSYRVARLRKKVQAGAQFIQTQSVFDIKRFEQWMDEVRKERLHKKVKILAGVTPLKSAAAARYINEKVPGITIPNDVTQRLEQADNVWEESLKICVETIKRLQEMEGVAGVHIMAIAWESVVPEIIKRASLYPRPEIRGC